MIRVSVTIGAAGLVAGLLSGLPQPAGAAIQTLHIAREMCTEATRQAEEEAGIPRHLLTAISLAESGRWDQRRRASFSWPWTVTNGGKSMYFPTKAEAIAAVEALRTRGETNIDVGCMQINLYYHPNAFETLEDAFDPTQNVAYASRFLAGLHKQKESWAEAAAHYHSNNPERNGPYREKVLRLWEMVSGRRHADLGDVETIEAEISDAALRKIQTDTINARFRARLEAEREAPDNSRALAQFRKWRSQHLGADQIRERTAAVRRAQRERTLKESLAENTQSFAEKRRTQLEEWRRTRSGSAFR